MNTKLESALATMSDGESLTIGAVTLHASKDGLSAWASGPNLNGNYLHTDADECARVEALLAAAPAPISGLWNLRPAIDDRGAEYGIVYRICEGSGALVAIAESESIARSIIDAHNNAGQALTVEQRSAIRCAYADLKGADEAMQSGDLNQHDWNGHQISIDDLEKAFPFVTE